MNRSCVYRSHVAVVIVVAVGVVVAVVVRNCPPTGDLYTPT